VAEIASRRGAGAPVAPMETAVSQPRGWAGFVVPSVGDLVFVVLLISLAAGPLARRLLGDAGTGWHIRTGELILRTGTVPRVDPFSSTMSGKAWYAWEWLYDAMMGAVHGWAGLNGVVFFTAVVIALTFALVFRGMRARGASLPIAVGMLLLAVAASTIHFFARPHVLSWFFTLIWFGVLEKFEAEGKAERLVWLPVLMLAWVNLHGGFLVGFVLLGIYLVGAWVKQWRSGGQDGARRTGGLVIAGAVSFALTFANPYGYALDVHVYRYLTDRFLMDHIDEFQSPNFHGVAQKCFAAILLLTLAGIASARKKPALSEGLLVAFAVYAGLYASRNIPVSSMLLVLIAAPLLSDAIAGASARAHGNARVRNWLVRFEDFGDRMGGLDSGMRGHGWAVLAVVLAGLWVCVHQRRPGARPATGAQFSDQRFPVRAVDFLIRSHVREPVFSLDAWGGYIIYRLYPHAQVVVDDRHDLYGAEFLKNYLKVMRVQPGWDQALEAMKTNWVLLPKDSAPANLLKQVPQWKAVYADDRTVLFSRAHSSGALE
jgi:hypothetical protein